MVAHNCHGKSSNLTAVRITSPCGKKKKTLGKKKNLTAKRKRLEAKRKTSRQKRKRLKAKRKPHDKKKKTCGKISSIPRGHFNSYFFYREVMVIFSAVRFSFSCEVNSFAVTVVGHHTFEILFPKILDFSTCGYSRELA